MIVLLWTVSVVQHLNTILVVAVTVTSITQVTASLQVEQFSSQRRFSDSAPFTEQQALSKTSHEWFDLAVRPGAATQARVIDRVINGHLFYGLRKYSVLWQPQEKQLGIFIFISYRVMNLLVWARGYTTTRPNRIDLHKQGPKTRDYLCLLFIHFLYLKDSSIYGQYRKNNAIILSLILCQLYSFPCAIILENPVLRSWESNLPSGELV